MYTIYDSINEELVGMFNDYESAQMFLLHMSDYLLDGGSNLTIEAISEPEDWAANNAISLKALV
jgi:hypothetical protein